MSAALVVVESPAKAKTLERYLGKGYKVMASYGHVRDLLPKSGSVDPEQDFAMNYQVIDRSARFVNDIARAVGKSDVLFLATDPDREGEAISWHLCELLRDKGALDDKEVKRVVFHEVTKDAVLKAMDNPGELSESLINAQQARRALDYLVGFNLSPLLWRKIHTGLSAGRVQSPALRMIVEREEEIERFEPREYWSMEADLAHAGMPFVGRLVRFEDEKIEQFSITDERRARQVAEVLERNAAAQLERDNARPGGALDERATGALVVSNVERKQRKRHPAPPFITSTLQQEAVRKLGLTARNAMRIAQQLYEGIDIGNGPVGLITYMRTDSVNMASAAIDEIRGFIEKKYGAECLPPTPRRFKVKSKNAQEAHEAVRPTSVRRDPQSLKARLSRDQFRLYDLVWKRAVASQMAHALIDTVAVDMDCGRGAAFRANGATVAEKGFTVLYQEGEDDKKQAPRPETDEKILPPMQQGDRVAVLKIRPEQHFTEPPPRFSEAGLVKALEEYGIGRPSTYASIIATLLNREYVEMQKKRFTPTETGRTVSRFLSEHFTPYVDYDFTAKLEDDLDAVSRGEKEWRPLLQDFWGPFHEKIKDKDEGVSRKQVTARFLGDDPTTGAPVTVKVGRFGPYVQLGDKDDEKKPRFAGLQQGQRMDSINLEQALELLKLPRELGESPSGEKLIVNIGRYGPYVRYGDRKYASLEPEDDPYAIDLPRALILVEAKKKADAERNIRVFEEEGISVLNGRFGPYITDGKKNANVPKDRKPAELSLEDCRELLAAAPERRQRRGKARQGAVRPAKRSRA